MDRSELIQYIESRLSSIRPSTVMKIMLVIEEEWLLPLDYDKGATAFYINTYNFTLQQLAELQRIISE